MCPDFPVGIDLVEFRNAASFYKKHQGRLNSFCSKEETDFIRRSPKPHESLALLLAAKEAVFKAFCFQWMGGSGFKNIQIIPPPLPDSNKGSGIIPQSDEEFSFKLKGSFKKFSSMSPVLKISFMKHKDYIVAHCRPEVFSQCAGI